MKNTRSATGMNLYEGYLALQKKEKGPGVSKRVLALLPLGVLLLILLGIGAFFGVKNIALGRQVKNSQARIEALQPAYDQAVALERENGERQGTYQELATGHLLFSLYPALTREVFTKVRACAENVFTITQYDYSEADGVLLVYANAASVNEVPKLVERLRDTGLFRSVHYTGYTSDSNQRYYCTVGCTLDYHTDITE